MNGDKSVYDRMTDSNMSLESERNSVRYSMMKRRYSQDERNDIPTARSSISRSPTRRSTGSIHDLHNGTKSEDDCRYRSNSEEKSVQWSLGQNTMEPIHENETSVDSHEKFDQT